jgi:signal transduction histidine kinase
MVAGAAFGRFVLGIEQLPFGALTLVALAVAGYNALLQRARRRGEASDWRRRAQRRLQHVSVILDYSALTAALWLVGGAGSPFQGLYLLHILVAALAVSRRAAWAHAALAFGLFAAISLVEWLGAATPPQIVGTQVQLEGAGPQALVVVLGVQAVLMSVAAWIATLVAVWLREQERALRAANARLESLSSLRRDFLHIVLHDVKAPIGAVRSILQALSSGYGGPVADDQRDWLQRCLDRLSGLTRFLRDLGLLADLDTEALRENAQPIDPGRLVRKLVAENQDLAVARRQDLVAEVEPHLPPVRGQERLLREALLNYVVNAIRYTPERGTIAVRARRSDEAIRFEVADTGVGIAPEDQDKLFREFSPIRRKGEQVESAGSGLGLSIVRRIVELHDGRVGFTSVEGEGSTFWAEIPTARSE